MTYAQKLKDPRWQKKRLLILNRDNWICQFCGDKKGTLHIHHWKYDGEPWEVKNEDLITACSLCHGEIEYINKHIPIKSINDFSAVKMYSATGDRISLFTAAHGSLVFKIFDDKENKLEAQPIQKPYAIRIIKLLANELVKDQGELNYAEFDTDDQE